jgi:ABC-type uncharacterized transport system permease subunit
LAPELADALSIISLLIMLACVLGYTWLSNRAKKVTR